MNVKFSNLPLTQELTIVTLGDYFRSDGPDVDEVITKERFIENQLDGGEYSFDDFIEGSGDGADNFVVLTILDGKIAVVSEE